jgi:ribonuclease HI
MITIFTDGSSRGNPGPGGWGTVIVDGDIVIEMGGGEKETTNNRMELKAAIQGISHTKEKEHVSVYTDSSYVINGITKWIHGWKRNDWKTKTKEDVLNKDLWMDLGEAIEGRTVEWRYVGGHVGIVGNERCDVIATGFADGKKVELYNGSLEKYLHPNVLDISLDESKAANKKSDSARSKAKAYSYISMVNKKIETHATWAECEKRVKGVRGARFKKALDSGEEEQIIAEFRKL